MVTKVNRLQVTKKIGKLVSAFYSDLNQAHEKGRKVAWSGGTAHVILLMRAMDIAFQHSEGYGAWCTGHKMQGSLLRSCEEGGYSAEICSYEQLGDGAALQIVSNTAMSPEVLIPRPDFVLVGSLCPNHRHYAESIGHIFNIPVRILDIPLPYSPEQHKESYARNVAYVERQITEDIIPFLEKMTGRSFNYDRLSELILNLKRVIELRTACLNMCKHIPAPCNVLEFGMSQAPIIFLAGDPEGVRYFEEFKAELEQRVSQGIGSVPEEKYRLYLHHLPVWHKLKDQSEKLAGYGAVLAVGSYTHGPHFSLDLKFLDPEHPIQSLAAMACDPGQMAMAGGTCYEWVEWAVKEYSVDGLIMINHRTCRILDIGYPDFLRSIEKRLRVPGVMIDADPVDPNFYNEAVWDTKIQALLETIDAGRQHGKAR